MEEGKTGRGQVSPDGQFIWDGIQWLPITGTSWEPTNWTRPIQSAVALYWAIAGAVSILTPFLFGQALKDAALKQVVKQNPSLPPDTQQAAVQLGFTIALVFAIVFGLVYLALAALSIFRRITWVFYANLVLLGLSSIGVVSNLVALSGSDNASPTAATGVGLLLSTAALVLFVWMLIARIRRGVWACRSTPRTAGAAP